MDCGTCLGRIENVEIMISSEPYTDENGDPLGRDVAGFTAARENSTYIYNIGNDYNNVAANAFESIITIEAETSGRYVRVQKSGTNPNGNTLNLVEIQIFLNLVTMASRQPPSTNPAVQVQIITEPLT